MTVDWTVNFPTLFLGTSLAGSFLWGTIKFRDAFRGIQTTLGSTYPERQGILGKLADHSDRIGGVERLGVRNRQIIIEMNAMAPEEERVRIERT